MELIFHLLKTMLLISAWVAIIVNTPGFSEFDWLMLIFQPKHELQETSAGSCNIIILTSEKSNEF